MNEHQNNPEKYKWGFLYFDPKDSRVIVPKSVSGMGYTLNFGNPVTYLVLIIFIALIVFVGSLKK